MLIIRLMWLFGVAAVVGAVTLGEEEEDEDESGGVGVAGTGGRSGASPGDLLDEGVGDQAPATPSLRLWDNTRQSALRPRKRDLHEEELLLILGQDYDPEWMRTTRPPRPGYIDINDTASRVAVKRLIAHAESLPWGGVSTAQLGSDARVAVSKWLLEMATCPLRYVWKDLGPDFWPRWLKNGQCPTQSNEGKKSCSWPPGMSCSPGPYKHLRVLRWHCRLRKGPKRKKNDNNVWGADKREDNEHHNNSGGGGRKGGKGGGRKRSRYRCLWIKVPYPVSEDCMCSC